MKNEPICSRGAAQVHRGRWEIRSRRVRNEGAFFWVYRMWRTSASWALVMGWVKAAAEVQSLCEAEARLLVWGSSPSAIDHSQTALWRQEKIQLRCSGVRVSGLICFVFSSTFRWPTSSKWGVYNKATKFLSQTLQEIYKTIRATILRDNIPKHWCHLALPLRRIILLWQHLTTRHKQRREDCGDRGRELKCVME